VSAVGYVGIERRGARGRPGKCEALKGRLAIRLIS